MNKQTLKLVKGKKNKSRPAGGIKPAKRRARRVTPPVPELTPAEASEAARFRALIAAKAARQAMVRRIMAELESLDDISPAA